MKRHQNKVPSNTGPFLKKKFIPPHYFQRFALTALQETRLLPSSPGPVAIDKFCDRKWNLSEDYEPLPADVMGYTSFTRNGVDRIVINTLLEEDSTPTGRIRVRSTTAHEIGHAVLHAELFKEKILFDQEQGELFGAVACPAVPEALPRQIVCRNSDVAGSQNTEKQKPSPWWEIQANRFMAELLLPKKLFVQVALPLLKDYETTEKPTELDNHLCIERAAKEIASVFNVSLQMADIAIKNYVEKELARDLEGSLL